MRPPIAQRAPTLPDPNSFPQQVARVEMHAAELLRSACISARDAWDKAAAAEFTSRYRDPAFWQEYWRNQNRRIEEAFRAWCAKRAAAELPVATMADAFAEPEVLRRFEALGALLAPVALLAYWPDADQIRRDLAPAAQNPRVFEAGHVRAVGFEAAGRSFIVFRGTSSRPEYLLDADLRRAGSPPCHRGFERAWQSLRPLVADGLRAAPSAPLVLAGHSLGAALALRAALDFAPNVEAVVAFAAPRVGGRRFRDRYQALDLDRRTVRFTQLTDIVSRIPPPIIGFTHVGTEVVLGYAGSQSSLVRTADQVNYKLAKVFPTPPLPGQAPPQGRYSTLMERLQPIAQIIPGYGLLLFPLAALALLAGALFVSFRDLSEHNIRKYCRHLRGRFPCLNVWPAADRWISRVGNAS